MELDIAFFSTLLNHNVVGHKVTTVNRMAKTRRMRKRKQTRRLRRRNQRGGVLKFESVGLENEDNTVVTLFPSPEDELENVPIVTSLSRARDLFKD